MIFQVSSMIVDHMYCSKHGNTVVKRHDNEYEVASRRHTEYTKLNNHPTERGHEQICEKVYDFINR